jgi:hypothetical protein
MAGAFEMFQRPDAPQTAGTAFEPITSAQQLQNYRNLEGQEGAWRSAEGSPWKSPEPGWLAKLMAHPSTQGLLNAANFIGPGPKASLKAGLSMDKGARMARAKEMGFDTPAYHATGVEFKPSGHRGASFFARTPEGASKGATGGAADMYGMAQPREKTMEVLLRSDDIEGLALTPKEREWFSRLPERTTYEDMIAARDAAPTNSVKTAKWWEFFDEVQAPDGSWSYIKRPMPKLSWDEAAKTGLDVYGKKHAHWGVQADEKRAAQRALEQGMAGYMQHDEGGLSIALADPRRVRSVDAAFDPAQIDSPNIFASHAAPAIGAAGAGSLGAFTRRDEEAY